ncbi:MAG: Lrp/AsnC family transcriptional regulator [Hyphomicrobium sp.]
MSTSTGMSIEDRLLEDWQRDFPLAERPFEVIANTIGCTERDVLGGVQALQRSGSISRVGGVVKPNTLGASTLAAMAVPDLQINDVAERLTREPGINHVYLRENDWNLWFVVTGPDRAYIEGVLALIQQSTGNRVLDLRLERPFHIDLGFKLIESNRPARHDILRASVHLNYCAIAGDRELVQILTQGLPVVPEPFKAVAQRLGRTEGDVIARLRSLTEIGVVPRIGVIVRHRALGWRSNAMVVWDVPENEIERAGMALAAMPGINLCYRRTRYKEAWPFNLYCMVHAKSRDDAIAVFEHATVAADLSEAPRKVLFSLRCYKQTGAMLARPKEAA